jgi:hypothetical protein
VLARDIGRGQRQASDVAAGARQTGDETGADRVGGDRQDDRDRRCLLLRRHTRLRADAKGDARIEPHQFRDEGGQTLGVSFRPTGLDREIVPPMAERLHPIPERGPERRA